MALNSKPIEKSVDKSHTSKSPQRVGKFSQMALDHHQTENNKSET